MHRKQIITSNSTIRELFDIFQAQSGATSQALRNYIVLDFHFVAFSYEKNDETKF